MSATETIDGERALRLPTPEGTDVTFELAHPIERAFAYALDVLFSQIATVLLILGTLALVGVTHSEIVLALALVGWFAIRYGYFVFFEIRMHGSTPAKRIMRLRVVARDGSPLTIESVMARNVMRDLEVGLPVAILTNPEAVIGRAPWWLSLPAVLWLALIMILPFITRDRTRAGDLIAGTVVVRVPKSELLRDEARAKSGSTFRFGPSELTHYGEHELETLATLLRSAEEGRADEHDLRTVARAIATRIGFEGRHHERAPLEFLRAFYRAQRTELERLLVLGKRIADKHERGRPPPSA